MNSFLRPNWPAPQNIKAYTTLRAGGVSLPPYDQFNLATHVADNHDHVKTNRMLLKQTLQLPAEPIWIKQTHSTLAIPAELGNTEKEADASFTQQPKQICIVLTADCLPILLCNRQGTHVAAVHAGWRGLANGIIEATLKMLNLPGEDILAWLGPAISARHYEVGNEVRDAFISQHPEALAAFTASSKNQHWFADLYLLAQLRLKKQGITSIHGGNYCTYSDKDNFFSYRRDGAQTGRMASLIWVE